MCIHLETILTVCDVLKRTLFREEKSHESVSLENQTSVVRLYVSDSLRRIRSNESFNWESDPDCFLFTKKNRTIWIIYLKIKLHWSDSCVTHWTLSGWEKCQHNWMTLKSLVSVILFKMILGSQSLNLYHSLSYFCLSSPNQMSHHRTLTKSSVYALYSEDMHFSEN